MDSNKLKEKNQNYIMNDDKKNTIEKGQRGTVAFLAIAIVFLIAATVDAKSEYAIHYIFLMVGCSIAGAIWNLLFIRCPECRKYVGEYMLFGPPIKVSKHCEHCGYKLREFD